MSQVSLKWKVKCDRQLIQKKSNEGREQKMRLKDSEWERERDTRLAILTDYASGVGGGSFLS